MIDLVGTLFIGIAVIYACMKMLDFRFEIRWENSEGRKYKWKL